MREVKGNKRGRRVEDIDNERSIFESQITTAPFIDKPISAIRTVHVEDWIRDRANTKAVQVIRRKEGIERRETDRTLSASRIRHALRVLRQILDRAVAEEIIDRNPADGVEPPHDADSETR